MTCKKVVKPLNMGMDDILSGIDHKDRSDFIESCYDDLPNVIKPEPAKHEDFSNLPVNYPVPTVTQSNDYSNLRDSHLQPKDSLTASMIVKNLPMAKANLLLNISANHHDIKDHVARILACHPKMPELYEKALVASYKHTDYNPTSSCGYNNKINTQPYTYQNNHEHFEVPTRIQPVAPTDMPIKVKPDEESQQPQKLKKPRTASMKPRPSKKQPAETQMARSISQKRQLKDEEHYYGDSQKDEEEENQGLQAGDDGQAAEGQKGMVQCITSGQKPTHAPKTLTSRSARLKANANK